MINDRRSIYSSKVRKGKKAFLASIQRSHPISVGGKNTFYHATSITFKASRFDRCPGLGFSPHHGSFTYSRAGYCNY
jgi:hypothetical protein